MAGRCASGVGREEAEEHKREQKEQDVSGVLKAADKGQGGGRRGDSEGEYLAFFTDLNYDTLPLTSYL